MRLFEEEKEEEIDRELLIGDLMKSAIVGCLISAAASASVPAAMSHMFSGGTHLSDFGMALYLPGMEVSAFISGLLIPPFAMNTIIYGAIAFVLIKVWRQYAS